ncbi:MAG: hypothetical protein V3S56_04225 [Gemmatimonadota bacterium]
MADKAERIKVGAMQYSTTTDALLQAIKCDVKFRIDEIVDTAELAAMSLESGSQIDQVLEQALLLVEDALAEAAHAMAREIHRERAS